MRPWVLYSIVRLGIFVVLLALMLLLGVVWWIAAIAAALIALCISFLFLGRLRGQVSAEIAEARSGAGRPAKPGGDESVEDAGTDDPAQ